MPLVVEPSHAIHQDFHEVTWVPDATAETNLNMALTRHLTPGQLVRSGPRYGDLDASRDINRWRALAAICVSTFVVLTDFMAVAVALPSVQKSFSISFAELQWVVEAFVLALTVGVLAAGYATMRFGSRRVFLTSVVVLASGSLLAALAPSADILIVGRAVQGVGGAMLLATGASILAEVFSEAHGRVGLAVWGAVTAVAVGLSPLVGGVIDTWLGWRWIFGLAALASALAFVLGRRSIGPSVLDRATVAVTDWRGLMLFAAGTVILVVGLIGTTTTLGGWSQSGVLACFACSGLLLVAFVAVEAVSLQPVLDVTLFRRRTFAGSAAAAFGLSAAVLGPFIFLVLFLSYSLGYSTLNIGGHLLLLSGMTIVLLPLAGALDRYVPVKVIICVGLVLVGAGLWLMSRLSGNDGWSDLVPGLILAGVGLELVNPRLASTAAAAVAAEERSVVAASRATTAVRFLGTATGVAVLGSLFATRLTDELSSRLSTLSQLSGQGPQTAGLVLEGRRAAAIGAAPRGLRAVLASAVQTSFAAAMHDVFLVSSAVALISGLVALCIRSGDVPARERAMAAPTRAGLSSAERGRAQLVPGPFARSKARPVEVVRPPVVHVEVVHAEVAPAPSPLTEPGGTPVETHAVFTTPPDDGFVLLSSSDTLPPGPTTVDVPGAYPARPVSDGVNGDEAEAARPRAEDETGQTAEPEGWAPDDGPQTEVVTVVRGDADMAPGPVNTGSLAVRVTRAQDGLLLKAELTIVGSSAEVVARHWTGTDGELILTALPPGNYELVVQKLGYRPETALVVVAEGTRQSVELALVGMAHIYGAVEGPGGGWLPGVLLTLTDVSGGVVATTKTDAAGSYHFPRVPEGSYTVSAPAYFGATSAVEIGPGSAVAADVMFGPPGPGK
jgi:MFS family permease